jgi:predicted RNA methylase
MTSYSATYDPADDKIRLTASARLDAETYAEAKAAGFRWAPRQEVFYAMWTPAAEDLATGLAGEIGDEDTSLAERAENRAERFGDYQGKRAAEAEGARRAVSAIADNIPFGQPILVGHHSERHARRDAQRIEDGMRRAIRLWDTSEYWQDRAAGALRHARYKELPAVRARRIKGLEADQRKFQRDRDEMAKWLQRWNTPGLPIEVARLMANHCTLTVGKNAAGFDVSAYAALREDDGGAPSGFTLADVVARANEAYPRTVARCDRWISHLGNRLLYERALLDEQGASALLDKPKRAVLPPILNYRGEGGVVACRNRYHRGQIDQMPQRDMTAAEYAAIHADYKGTRLSADGSHRIRQAMVARHELVAVFITDGKVHVRPEPGEANAPEQPPVRIAPMAPLAVPMAPPSPEGVAYEAIRSQLAAGVRVAVAPSLFPTPPDLAARVAEEAGIEPGMTVLEPSAGTGALVVAASVRGGAVTAVEVNHALAEALARRFADVRRADFLQCNGDLGTFDRVLMNPPFAGQADIEHVTHAMRFLKPGGRLAAIMSAGVTFRQDRKAQAFRALVERCGGRIEAMPDGTFRDAGTDVRTVLVTMDAAG